MSACSVCTCVHLCGRSSLSSVPCNRCEPFCVTTQKHWKSGASHHNNGQTTQEASHTSRTIHKHRTCTHTYTHAFYITRATGIVTGGSGPSQASHNTAHNTTHIIPVVAQHNTDRMHAHALAQAHTETTHPCSLTNRARCNVHA